jgi:hypothetical protein
VEPRAYVASCIGFTAAAVWRIDFNQQRVEIDRFDRLSG